MIGMRELFLRHVAQTSDAPLLLEVVRAQGIYLFDTHDRPYIDLISGIGVSNLGHHQPEIIKAIQEQSEKFMHLMVYGEFIHQPQVALSKLITSILPATLNQVFLVNSGTEATEGAIKLSKRYTGRPGIISFKNAYHGSTNGALSLMGDEYFKNAYRPLLPASRQIRFNNVEDLRSINEHTAAVFTEIIKAEEGVILPQPGYLKKLRERCNDTGTLLVADEIQTAMGRTGRMFAFEEEGIVPDILLLAKAFGGGMPIGAFIADQKIMSVFKNDPILGHLTTFGGHPVCAAAAHKAVEITIRDMNAFEVERKESYFKARLKHICIREVRSRGLMIAVELMDAKTVQNVVRHCMEAGLIIDWFLFAPHCLRIAPPLIIKPIEIDQACDIILAALDKCLIK